MPKKVSPKKPSVKKKSSIDNSNGLAERLRIIRCEVLNLTQKELSDALSSISQANISQIEKGICLPNAGFFQRLAERFPEIDFNWIFYNEGEPKRSDDAKKAESREIATKAEQRKAQKEVKDLKVQIEKLRNDNSKLIDIAAKRK